jgi:DNA-binding transcriptional LysR family regulator
VPLASNSVSVQLNWLRQGAGIGMVHDFAMPAAPELVKVLPADVSLTRAFWLIRHADDRRIERIGRFADRLAQGIRREVARLEAMT